MKYYIVEPSYKKSFVEYTAFRKVSEDGERMHLTKELGWRWGSFMLSVPETEEEAHAYIKEQGYDNVLDWAVDFGHTITNEENEEVLPQDVTVIEMVQQQALPSESDDFVDITEDYPGAEFIDAWDGCWEWWNVNSYPEIDDAEKDTIIEQVEEAYGEEYEEGVENLGWEFVDTYYEIHSKPTITECDENGNKVEEDETDS